MFTVITISLQRQRLQAANRQTSNSCSVHLMGAVHLSQHANTQTGQSRCNFASLHRLQGNKHLTVSLDLNELLMVLGTKEGLGLREAPLQSTQSSKQMGCTNRTVSSHDILAEVNASGKAVLNDNALREDCSRGWKGSFTKALSTI